MNRATNSKGEPPKRWKPKIADGPKYKLLEKHKEELYEIFEMLDDGSGAIKIKDVQVAFKSINFVPDEAELKRLFKGIHGDKITADNLINIMENKIAEDESKTDLKRVFGCFDQDHKGYITCDDLRRIADELGVDIHDEEIEEMIEEADLNEDGVVTEEEFVKIMLKVEL